MMLPKEADEQAGGVDADPALPSWITQELIEDTLRVFQRYYPQRLTRRDACEILINMGNLFDVLEWTV